MKFCKDCENYLNEGSAEFAKCKGSQTVDLVTGEPRYLYCSTHRSYQGGVLVEGVYPLCGPEGSLYQEKVTTC